jgi:hypothetical protein
MRFQKFLHPFIYFTFLLFLLVQTSCEKFTGSQTIPAYLKIDSISLQTNYPTQGTASHNITDAWVYIDGVFIGTFQLPARFPVLMTGKHTAQIFGGIKKDGIATTRIAYPFYSDVSVPVNLKEDSTQSLGTLKVSYSTKAKFMWKEDFDDVALSLDTTKVTMVKVGLTPIGSPLTFEGLHSGTVTLDTAHPEFECVSHPTFLLPGSAIFLEMNFKSTITMEVGVFMTTSGTVYQSGILELLPTPDKWKKIYIDLSNTLYQNAGTSNFRVYFYAKNTSTATQQLFMDNIKLISF